MKCESTGVRLQHGQDFQRDGGVAKMERKEASEVAEVAKVAEVAVMAVMAGATGAVAKVAARTKHRW